MKAWICGDRQDIHAGRCVAFAETAAEAEEAGGLALSWDGPADVIRPAPEFDQYAPGPVPIAVLIAHGWEWPCHHCGDLIGDEGCGYCDPPWQEPVHAGQRVYCNPDCQWNDEQRARRKTR